MQDELLLDAVENAPQESNDIDGFFKSSVIFYGLMLLVSFLSGFGVRANSPLGNLLFNGLVFSVIGFNIFYFIFLIVKKKGIGRIILNVVHAFSMVVLAICFIFYFSHQEFRLTMLGTGLITVPFLLLTQFVYELAVRKSSSKFYSFLSFVGISVFSVGLLFYLQHWPYGGRIFVIGAVLTFLATVLHLWFILKKEAEYQIHIRYLAQCLFAIFSTIMILLA